MRLLFGRGEGEKGRGEGILVPLSERNAKISGTAYTRCSFRGKVHEVSAPSIVFWRLIRYNAHDQLPDM